MAFPPNLLIEGEEIALDVRPHWWTMVAPTIFVSVVAIGAIISVTWGGKFGKVASGILLIVLLIALLNLGMAYLRWNTTNFVVTNERIIFRHGVLAKHAKEMQLDRITNIAFNQTIFERVIGSGDLEIESAGETGQETFHNIRRPQTIHNEIYRQMEGLQIRDAQRNATMMGKATSANMESSIPEQITKLDDLRQKGMLSDEEFQKKKRELLDRM